MTDAVEEQKINNIKDAIKNVIKKSQAVDGKNPPSQARIPTRSHED